MPSCRCSSLPSFPKNRSVKKGAIDKAGFEILGPLPGETSFKLRKTVGQFTVEVSTPLFDPGAFQLLDFDPATELKLRGDPLLDKKLKLADRESLDQWYEIHVRSNRSQREMGAMVLIKPKLEIQKIWISPALQTGAESSHYDHFAVEAQEGRMKRLRPSITGLLGLLGFNQGTHQALLDLAREYEKGEYKEWLGRLRGHFGQSTASEILV